MWIFTIAYNEEINKKIVLQYSVLDCILFDVCFYISVGENIFELFMACHS